MMSTIPLTDPNALAAQTISELGFKNLAPTGGAWQTASIILNQTSGGIFGPFGPCYYFFWTLEMSSDFGPVGAYESGYPEIQLSDGSWLRYWIPPFLYPTDFHLIPFEALWDTTNGVWNHPSTQPYLPIPFMIRFECGAVVSGTVTITVYYQ
jgi:hypothetical protein